MSMASDSINAGTTLTTLPPELLAQILVHLESARTLSHISLACRKLHNFMERDGYRIYLQLRFPFFEPPVTHSKSFWRDAAHGLTALSRNWERKGLIAWSLRPPSEVEKAIRTQRTYRRGQTMGFIPTIDSREVWYGGDWSSRKEILVWGAGASLTMRVKTMGKGASKDWDARANEDRADFNTHRHHFSWFKYLEEGTSEGRDDITSVNLVTWQNVDGEEHVVVGRAGGGLSRITLSTAPSNDYTRTSATYQTAGRLVRSTAASINDSPLLAACLADSSIALYSLQSEGDLVCSISEASVIPPGQSGRTWSLQFLGKSQLLVGYGPSYTPIRVYDTSRGELSSKAQCTICPDAAMEARLDVQGVEEGSATSIYSLAPIPASSSESRTERSVFLSGAYDGLARLHDLRFPASTVATFKDPVDTFSPIYSLLPIGSERFVAGGARHSIIKVFDLRMPGDKLYYTADLGSYRNSQNTSQKFNNSAGQSNFSDRNHEANYRSRNWNLFLKMGNTHHGSRRAHKSSPVYALSRPSTCSPSIFAGVENQIVQIDVVSIMNKNPDPIFQYGPAETGSRQDIQRKWDPNGEAASLPMYEHNTGPVTLIKQQHVQYIDKSIRQGWDERWS